MKQFFYMALANAFAALMSVGVCQAFDILSSVNAVRMQSCTRTANKPAALRFNPKLDLAASMLLGGGTPHDAVAQAGYQAIQLASIHINGYGNDGALMQLLRQRYCENVGDPKLRDIGSAQRGDEAWIVLGAELEVPQNAAQTSNRVLELINAARSQARRCGSISFSVTAPLALNAQLENAARSHSQEMARYAYLEHQGRDNSTPAQRVSRAGYRWSHTGENIAAGPGTPEEVVDGWLKSPGHCANIMNSAFTEMGIAYAPSKDDYGIYWTQVFAAP